MLSVRAAAMEFGATRFPLFTGKEQSQNYFGILSCLERCFRAISQEHAGLIWGLFLTLSLCSREP